VSSRPGTANVLVAGWGVLGVLALLAQAIYRLTPIALEPLQKGQLNTAQAGLYFGWVLVNGYAEGYRGFQRGFAPRVVARAFHLAGHRAPGAPADPTGALHVALAPAFCMSLFHASRRGLVVAWTVLLAIVVVVTVVRQVPQPWRGIVDAGVVVGLLWGAAAIVVFFVRALAGEVPLVKTNLPEPSQPG
jgi:hypothetical protein